MTSALQLLETAKQAARLGGSIIKKGFGKLEADQIDLKGKGDFVTDLDRSSERAILDHIRSVFPDHVFHAEESGHSGSGESLYRWLVDPLDGTANYVQGIPFYCVSIGVMREKEIHAGVVYDPERDEMFWAVRGGGAFLNGRPIRVSEKENMEYAALASGFPWRSQKFIDPYLACFKALFLEAAAIRRLGAAALDLAYVACGRFDGFWEMRLNPWDIAAGVLIIQEAGGLVTDFRGEEDYLRSGNVVAGTPAIQKKMLVKTREHLAEIC